ncbi:hypothetical protein [Streptomyces sp. NRRL F-5053]|uniref:hypothetical protein n=1 Tax=Streptomyces sp. NRRL F-5053 TaxID=1463854 RepID=UPI0004CB3923|nr:hypothetical protein [Streptomyces sp. NRRL F-5053]
MRSTKEASNYADRVMEVLIQWFPPLGDPDTAALVRKQIVGHMLNPDMHLEVIISDPITARWRLTGHCRSRLPEVRLGCWAAHPSPEDTELERLVNTRLAALCCVTPPTGTA